MLLGHTTNAAGPREYSTTCAHFQMRVLFALSQRAQPNKVAVFYSFNMIIMYKSDGGWHVNVNTVPLARCIIKMTVRPETNRQNKYYMMKLRRARNRVLPLLWWLYAIMVAPWVFS